MASSYETRLGDAPEEGVKAPVVVATNAAITLLGEQTIKSVAVVAGDRVLVRNQADATENGIYDVKVNAWTRAKDWNAANDVIAGVLVADASDGSIFQAFFDGDYTPDTTEVTFSAWVSVTGELVIVDLINDLRSQVPTISEWVQVRGNSSVGDGDGYFYYWDDSSTATDDGYRVIKVTTITIGRWIRVFDGTVQTVDSSGDDSLYDHPGNYDGQQAQVAGYYTPGDGGGGLFVWDADNSDSDDGGVTIVPTGQGATGRWVKSIKGAISVKEFGAVGDGSTDDYTALDAMRSYLESLLGDYKAGQATKVGLVDGAPAVVFPSGKYLLSDTFIFLPGVRYIGESATLLADTNGMILARSYDPDEIGARFTASTSKQLHVTGVWYFDGDDKASIGVKWMGLARHSHLEYFVHNCTYEKFTTTGTGSAGTSTLTVASATDIVAGDTIHIANVRGLYTVMTLSGTTLTLDRPLRDAASSDTVTHLAVGDHFGFCQQTVVTALAQYNTLNRYVGRWYNASGATSIDSTDMQFYGGGSQSGVHGVLVAGSSNNNFWGSRFQQSTGGSDLIVTGCNDLGLHDCFFEPCPDDEITLTQNEIQALPVVDLLNGQNIFLRGMYAHNPNITTWRRFLRNRTTAAVAEVTVTPGNVNANPDSESNISGATQADPVVITTDAAHGYSTGDVVRIDDVGGMTEINERSFVITVLTTTTFELDDEDGTGHTAYTSGGTAASDLALIEQDAGAGQIWVRSVSGPANYDVVTAPLIDSNGDRFNSSRMALSRSNEGPIQMTGKYRYWAESTQDPVVQLYIGNEEYAQLELRGARMYLGNGSATADAGLRRFAPGVIGPEDDHSLRITPAADSVGGQVVSTLQLVDANGTVHHLWVDSSGDLKINATYKPSNELTGGTVVGTQT